MKNFFLLVILFVQFSLCSQRECQVISPLTYRVVMRYYLIARLTHAIDLIEKMIDSQKHNNKNTYISNVHIDELRQQWAFLKSYRHIDNLDFERLVTTEILKITYYLFYSDTDIQSFKTEEEFEKESVDQLLEEIDEITDCFECERTNKILGEDKKIICCPDDVVYRLYAIERLKRAFVQLDRIEKYDQYRMRYKRSPIEGLHELEGLISHNRIVQVVQHMLNEKKLTALFNLWAEVQYYRYAEDHEFLGNMLMVVFSAYKNLLENIGDGHEKTDITKEMQAILLLYDNISILSTEELLSGIDIATDHLEHLLNNLDESRSWYQRILQWFWF